MLDSSDKDFPKQWLTIGELCARGANRALIDHYVREGRVYTLIRGGACWYSTEPIDDAMASDAAHRMGDEDAIPVSERLPPCSKSGNLHK